MYRREASADRKKTGLCAAGKETAKSALIGLANGKGAAPELIEFVVAQNSEDTGT